ncbi:MAG TPA: TetR/AcrR family transcriptional regulator [bacterium]
MPKNERNNAVLIEAKRRRIAEAALRVFANKGYHPARISDIANEAGVAYGLVYHYFKNKEEILNSVFQEMWGHLSSAIEGIASGTKTFYEKLYDIVSLMIDGYKRMPELIEVLIIQFARSPKFTEQANLRIFEKTFKNLEGIIRFHQGKSDVRKDINSRLLSYMFFGAIETTLTGVVMGTLKKDNASLETLKRNIVDTFINGILNQAVQPLQKRER